MIWPPSPSGSGIVPRPPGPFGAVIESVGAYYDPVGRAVDRPGPSQRSVQARLRGPWPGSVPPQRAADPQVLRRGAARGAGRPRGAAVVGRGGDPGGDGSS